MNQDLLNETFISELWDDDSYQLTDIGSDAEDEEKIVGTMNEAEKKIWSLANHKDKLAMMMRAKHQYENCTDDEKKVLAVEFKSCKVKAEALREIMWILIKDRLRLWEFPSIGIRKGFAIVIIEKKIGFPDFLKEIFTS